MFALPSSNVFSLVSLDSSDVFPSGDLIPFPPVPMARPRALFALVALVAATLAADAAAAGTLSEAQTLGRAEFVSCPA